MSPRFNCLKVTALLCIALFWAGGASVFAVNPPPVQPCTPCHCSGSCPGGTMWIGTNDIFVWPDQPMCMGEVWAWASEESSSNVIVTTYYCDNATTNCPPSYSTNTYWPSLVTNWYVVDHPGYSGSGPGWWVDFIPTNCGKGSITFYGVYVNYDPCTGQECGGRHQFSQKVDLNIVNVQIAEPWKATCTNSSTSFTLTNTCGDVTWEVATNGTGGEPTASGSTITAGTNCGQWTITARSKINTNCTASATLYVVAIESECAAATPTNQNRTTIGVGEDVNLSACGVPPGDVTWTRSGGTLSVTNGPATTLTAPCTAGSVTVTLHYTNGSCDKTFSVIAPNNYIAKTNRTDGSYGKNVAGSGMYIDLWLAPTNVSFGAVWVMEVGRVSTNATGYFANTNVWPTNNLDHGSHGAGSPVHVGADNYIGQDHASSGVCPTPWSAGSFTWPIPAVWWIPGCSTNNLPWSDQNFTIDASGTVTVTKFGHTVTRNTNDVYTTFQ